jgi:hypothetical protein
LYSLNLQERDVSRDDNHKLFFHGSKKELALDRSPFAEKDASLIGYSRMVFIVLSILIGYSIAQSSQAKQTQNFPPPPLRATGYALCYPCFHAVAATAIKYQHSFSQERAPFASTYRYVVLRPVQLLDREPNPFSLKTRFRSVIYAHDHSSIWS